VCGATPIQKVERYLERPDKFGEGKDREGEKGKTRNDWPAENGKVLHVRDGPIGAAEDRGGGGRDKGGGKN